MRQKNLYLKKIRMALSITQAELADRIGVSIYLIKAVECGQQKMSDNLKQKAWKAFIDFLERDL